VLVAEAFNSTAGDRGNQGTHAAMTQQLERVSTPSDDR
jgi:hypothetical protein